MADSTKAAPDIYTIRKDGVIYAESYLPNCGYSVQILREMQRAGHSIYRNGKRVKIGGKADGK